jgi:hypothetical protein
MHSRRKNIRDHPALSSPCQIEANTFMLLLVLVPDTPKPFTILVENFSGLEPLLGPVLEETL